MPTISGYLKYVTNRPAAVTEVWVRASRLRTSGDGVITTSNDRIPVTGGQVSFEALPGPAVLALVESGRPVETIPIVVGDAPVQSLETVVLAAELATDAQRDLLEDLAAQVAQDAEAARANRVAAEGARDAAATSETNAAQSKQDAAQSASAAAMSASQAAENATSAAQDADRTESARAEAVQAQAGAEQAEANAAASEQAAATSASKAATSEANAQDSAAAAASSATEAEAHADRAEQAADPTGLRDEITQQLAYLVDGAPEDLDTIREVAEYAQENRDITDALNAAIGNKANKTHRHAMSQVEGLDDALAGKADTAVVNARPALFSGTGAPPSTIPNARVGDWWLNQSTMELSKITGV